MSRHIRQVELDDRAFAAVEAMRQDNGMTQKQVLTRIVEWVAALDKPSRQLVLGRLPAEYVADAAERLADCARAVAAGNAAPAPRAAAKRARTRATALENIPTLDALKSRRPTK